ncbi:STAM-binding protein [Trichinella pseudospiralis]|uniref:STAM-binding protein n=1 Tax=Trichinella pseudospiralis TaxID=6337 RepID=A0A0V0XS78_TRIPS|nr:STAM-binding protein [Trichinella pseudospiralis]
MEPIKPKMLVKEITSEASNIQFYPNIAMKKYARSAGELYFIAGVYELDNNVELAYRSYTRFIVLLVDHFPKHPEYSKFCREERDEYKKLMKNVRDAFDAAERLKVELTKQCELQYMNALQKQANEAKNAKEQQREHKVTSTSENSDYNHALSSNSAVSHGRVSNYYSQHDRVTPPAVVAPSTSSSVSVDMLRDNDASNDTYSTFNVDDLIELENANNRTTVGIPPAVVENLQAAECSSSRPPKPTFDRSTKPKLKTKTTTTSTPVRPPLPVVAPAPSSTPVSKYSGLQPVIIPKNLVFRFLDAAALNTAQEIETCGILSGKLIQSSFVVTHVIVPKQSGTSNSCIAHHEEEMFTLQDDLGLITLGWIHTHPTQSAFLSSVDLHTHCSYQLLFPEAVAIVCAPKHNEIGVFMLTSPYGLRVIANCKRTGFHPHSQNPPVFQTCEHVCMDNTIDGSLIDLRP